MLRALWVIGIGVMCCIPYRAVADVVVEEDEVIFTFPAGEAGSVFLVGSFNNWNPTLEKMERVGDVFEVRLFLLPGKYQYMFVVDGRRVNDPGNPPAQPEGRSSLTLVMRAGMLAIGDDEASAPEGGPVALRPSLRYTGRFFFDDNKTSAEQTIDLYFDYESEHLRSNIDFKTSDDTWDVDPLTADLRFNTGYLELRFDNATLLGFENEETWTSNDPFRLVGDVGIYRYSAGRGRKGAAVELGKNSRIKLKALYADRAEEPLPTPVTIAADDLAGFAGSATPDTTLYRFDPRLEDEDTWALELSADFGSLRLGYGSRRNRGLHPGVLSTVTRGSGNFNVATFGTREYWNGNAVWIGWKATGKVMLEGAYGHGSATLRQLVRSDTVVTTLGDVAPGQDATGVHSDADLQSGHRWRGGLVYEDGPWTGGAHVEWNKVEFTHDIYERSEAKFNTVAVHAGFEPERWSVVASMAYADQDYADTPDDFHIHTGERNFWLDYADDLTIAHLAAFDLARFSEMSVRGTWRDADSTVTVRADLDWVAENVFASTDYLAARVSAEYRPWWRWYVQGDARIASYDKPWLRETFFAPYVEAGYRHRGVELSLGVGLDPVVLDPVVNDYRDNGREQFLRQAIPNGLMRSQAAALGAAVAERERQLEDVNAIKLEAIIKF